MNGLQGTQLDSAVHLHHVDECECTEKKCASQSALADLRLIQEVHEDTLFPYYMSYFPKHTTKPPAAVKSVSTVKGGDIVGGVDQQQLSQQQASARTHTHTERK